ncbi:MAG: plasmid pRiA4b ORF-3 family protein [Oscillospiraceae bacterium]|nr:plasmid pRiA4b ORF-3 family protein [Oscillospiraceae bacterium]MDD4367323.1 plasmid pRiA4b ORF-3 family protein [Oscillospiraceae bacterium]
MNIYCTRNLLRLIQNAPQSAKVGFQYIPLNLLTALETAGCAQYGAGALSKPEHTSPLPLAAVPAPAEARPVQSEALRPAWGEKPAEDLFSWHAGLLAEDSGVTAVILINDATRYPLVIVMKEEQDYAQLDRLFGEALTLALQTEGVSDLGIGRYFTAAGAVCFLKACDRRQLGRLNAVNAETQEHLQVIDARQNLQRFASLELSRCRRYRYPAAPAALTPARALLNQLHLLNQSPAGTAARPLQQVTAYQLLIALGPAQKKIAWRRVVVPAALSFRYLHNVIQTVFDWHDQHLHRFVLDTPGLPETHILMPEDPEEILGSADSRGVKRLDDRYVALKDIVPLYGSLGYTYDLSDRWTHEITYEKTVTLPQMQVCLLDEKGERPPEDVGGFAAFSVYLQIMANPDHADHQAVKDWSDGQIEGVYTEAELKRRLEDVYFSY